MFNVLPKLTFLIILPTGSNLWQYDTLLTGSSGNGSLQVDWLVKVRLRDAVSLCTAVSQHMLGTLLNVTTWRLVCFLELLKCHEELESC